MTWLTRDLTLDLLAIAIHGLTKASERIAQEPDPAGEWPPRDTPTTTSTNEEKPQVEPPARDEEQPESNPEPKQKPDTSTLLTEAKTLLQTLSRAGHREWIKDTLLPQFKVTKLTDVPADQLPALIETAKQKENA